MLGARTAANRNVSPEMTNPSGGMRSSRTPMTTDYIAFHAAERPGAIAFIINGREIRYAEFARDIRKITRALREFELWPGAKVAIGIGDVYFRWLLRLGFEQLRVVTFTGLERLSSPRLLGNFDLVLSATKSHGENVKRQWEVTPEWLDRIIARTDSGEDSTPTRGPDDPLRILFTSGTTGTPKKLLYSRQVHEGSVTKMLWFANFTPRSRYLDMVGSVAASTACIRAGGSVVVENRMTAGEAIASHSITHTTLTPILMRQLLDELPNGFVKPAELKIFSSGAALSKALRDQARARAATEVSDIYGSNEAGYVSSIRDDAEFGSVWPGVQVEVVDDRDKPMPLGEVGRIRVKTDRMVQEYLDDPEATKRMFKEGWFYARDLGILHGGHRLQVVGRSDEIFNISGQKISPNVLEDLIASIDTVGDVGACSIQNADGIEEIFIAVSGARVGEQELSERINRTLDAWLVGRVYVMKVDQIPRNASGKIERDFLRSTAARWKLTMSQPRNDVATQAMSVSSR